MQLYLRCLLGFSLWWGCNSQGVLCFALLLLETALTTALQTTSTAIQSALENGCGLPAITLLSWVCINMSQVCLCDSLTCFWLAPMAPWYDIPASICHFMLSPGKSTLWKLKFVGFVWQVSHLFWYRCWRLCLLFGKISTAMSAIPIEACNERIDNDIRDIQLHKSELSSLSAADCHEITTTMTSMAESTAKDRFWSWAGVRVVGPDPFFWIPWLLIVCCNHEFRATPDSVICA